MNNLVWFRNDLRTIDNKALFEACKDENINVLGLFIFTPIQWKKHNISPKKIFFVKKNLICLQESLDQLNISLFFIKCNDFNDTLYHLKNFCITKKIKKIFYNRQYELDEFKRDQKIEKKLGNKFLFYSFDSNFLLKPNTILNSYGQMYKIFTPFYNKFLRKLKEKKIKLYDIPKIRKNIKNKFLKESCNSYYSFLKKNKNKQKKNQYGENYALNKLKKFFIFNLSKYHINRNIPFLNGTSGISPYLTIGVISTRQCLNLLEIIYPKFLEKKDKKCLLWIKEILWREFYHNIIINYPFVCKNKPFIKWTNNILWENNSTFFYAWKNGKTGYPIIDAAMRQLNKLGWMHNRLRMISASFLVKHLLIDWRYGEKYFMSKLIDGDFASNNGGWQWSASTGNDSVPYFRIFNPILQTKRFDPDGLFIKKWIPELKNVPIKYICQPTLWSKKFNQILDYPEPIIDHKIARKKCLYIFYKAKAKKF